MSKTRSSTETFDVVNPRLFLGIVLFYFGLLKFQPLNDMIKVVLRELNQTFELSCVFCCYFCVKFHFHNDYESRSEFLAKPVIARLYLGKMSSKNAPLLPHHLVSNNRKFQSKHSDLKILSILNIVGIVL